VPDAKPFKPFLVHISTQLQNLPLLDSDMPEPNASRFMAAPHHHVVSLLAFWLVSLLSTLNPASDLETTSIWAKVVIDRSNMDLDSIEAYTCPLNVGQLKDTVHQKSSAIAWLLLQKSMLNQPL
jgi:hypothetical protein